MAAPKTANINVTVGSNEYVVTHSNFISLSIKRKAKDVSDTFDLELFDTSAFEIEAALLAGNNYMEISYIDDDMKINKRLIGYAYKIEDSFYNNRVMLKISGLVSENISDKYEKYSFSWNTVPKFDWDEVLGDANWSVYDENYNEDGTLDQLAQGFTQLFRMAGGGLKALFTWNWSHVADHEEVIDRIFAKDWITMDKRGNYYVQKYKDLRDDSEENKSVVKNGEVDSDTEYENIVKSNDKYTIPIRPNKLLKLILCGGNFSDLLEKEYSDYKGTAFYGNGTKDANGDTIGNYSNAEWYYIKKWFKKMGKFPGMGYSSFECDYTLDWVEDDFTQTKQSFMEFIYNFVLNKCVQTDKKTKKKYSNFYLSFNNSNGSKASVKLSRIDASVIPTNAPQYIFYGKQIDDGKNKGRLVSFAPTLNIMTSMIAQGTVASDDSDLSEQSLVDVNGKVEVTKAASNASTENRYKVNWGVLKISPAASYTANGKMARAAISDVFEKASMLSYRATANIEGFNTLSPQDYIEIIVVPKNDSGQPSYHHTSGIYFILEMEDTISNGKYSSSLTLIKNIQNMGSTANVSKATTEAEMELAYKVTPVARKTNSNSSILEIQMESQTNPNRYY